MVNSLPASAGDARDAGSIPGLEDPLKKEMNPLQYPCLENSMEPRELQFMWAQRVRHD